MNILQQATRMVVNQIMVDVFAPLFNIMTMSRSSD